MLAPRAVAEEVWPAAAAQGLGAATCALLPLKMSFLIRWDCTHLDGLAKIRASFLGEDRSLESQHNLIIGDALAYKDATSSFTDIFLVQTPVWCNETCRHGSSVLVSTGNY